MPIDFNQINAKQFALLEGLEEQAIRDLLSHGFSFSYLSGSNIVVSKDLGRTFFLITKGIVKIALQHAGHVELNLTLFHAGDFFGELILLQKNLPRTASVTAIGDVEVIAIQEKDFFEAMNRHPALLMNLTRELGRRIRTMNERVIAMAVVSPYKEAMSILHVAHKNWYHEPPDLSAPDGSDAYPLPNLAFKDWLLLSHSSSDQFLQAIEALRNKGFLEWKNKQIVIKSFSALREFALNSPPPESLNETSA